MNYYQITFNPQQTQDIDFTSLKTIIAMRHLNNSWSHDTDPMWIVATPVRLPEFLQGLGFDKENSTSALSALLEKGLVIHQLQENDVIPQEDAQAWFLRRKLVLQQLAQTLSNNPK